MSGHGEQYLDACRLVAVLLDEDQKKVAAFCQRTLNRISSLCGVSLFLLSVAITCWSFVVDAPRGSYSKQYYTDVLLISAMIAVMMNSVVSIVTSSVECSSAMVLVCLNEGRGSGLRAMESRWLEDLILDQRGLWETRYTPGSAPAGSFPPHIRGLGLGAIPSVQQTDLPYAEVVVDHQYPFHAFSPAVMTYAEPIQPFAY